MADNALLTAAAPLFVQQDPRKKARLSLAEAMMQQQQAQPQSWGEALSNVGSRLLGAYTAAKMYDQQKVEQDGARKTLTDALLAAKGTGGTDAALPVLRSNPQTSSLADAWTLNQIQAQQDAAAEATKEEGKYKLKLQYEPKIAGATEEAKNTPLVNRERLMNPVKAEGARQTAEATAPYDVAKSRAGAPNITVNAINKTNESIASQVGPRFTKSFDAATAAVRGIDVADRILDAVQSGKVIAGKGADTRLSLAQLGQTLGVTGKSTEDLISNTRTVIQGMAEGAVAARSQLGSQAQISNTEQEMLNRAMAGDIGSMTIQEIGQIAALQRRFGEQVVSSHNRLLDVGRNQEGAAGLVPYFEVPAPATRNAPGATNGLPAVQSDDDYDALPSGAEFVDPNGVRRRKL